MEEHVRTTDDDPWLPAEDAAAALRISPHTLYRFIAVGRLPAYRIKGRIQIRRSDVDRFVLEDRRVEPHEVAGFLEPEEPLRSIKMPNEAPKDYRTLPLEDDGGVLKLSWFGDREYYGSESLWVYSRRPDEGNWLTAVGTALFALLPSIGLLVVPNSWMLNPWGRGGGLALLAVLLVTAFRMPLLTLIQRAQVRKLRAAFSGMLTLVFGGLVVRFLGCFSALYWIISVNEPDAFSEPLSSIGAMYFALTTFSTTGFGDIVALSDGARAVVASQMGAGFLIVTVLIALAFRLDTNDDDVHVLPRRPTLNFHNWPLF